MDFVLEKKDYIGEAEGKKLYESIKDKLELVNTIKFPVGYTVSKSFIRGFQDWREENYNFIFFCEDEEQEKKIREDQKFLSDCAGTKILDELYKRRGKRKC